MGGGGKGGEEGEGGGKVEWKRRRKGREEVKTREGVEKEE